MTQKELNYVEDSLDHADFMVKKCSEAASQLVDPQLKKVVNAVSEASRTTFGGFYSVL
ncbi:MAG: hypothetical protein II794_06885 [Oscillospiraceae bacterium]|nr:hypothetical protein [Oscillospiraceae bacterium]